MKFGGPTTHVMENLVNSCLCHVYTCMYDILTQLVITFSSVYGITFLSNFNNLMSLAYQFKILMAVKSSTMVLWVVMSCGLVGGYPVWKNTMTSSSAMKIRGNMFRQNVSTQLPVHMVPQPRRPTPTSVFQFMLPTLLPSAILTFGVCTEPFVGWQSWVFSVQFF
jgi:hypothetical protein